MTYKLKETCLGSTQDVVHLIEAAVVAGAKYIEITHKEWHVVVEWPTSTLLEWEPTVEKIDPGWVTQG